MMRKLCVALILFVMFTPLGLKLTGAGNLDYVLSGYYESAARPEFSPHNFFSSEYQSQEDVYLQQNVPFKGFLIALGNQLDYSLFNILHYTIEQGEDGELFLWNHIDNHCGNLTISDDSLQLKIKECVYLKSVLDSLQVPFVFVLAPGKPGYMEDKLPSKYRNQCSGDNDYHHVLKSLSAARLPVIDYNQWFKVNRNNFKYPVFPRLGIHWSYYAGCKVVDSLAGYIGQVRQTTFAKPHLLNMRITDEPYKTDKDLWSLLNLLLPMRSDSLAYPEYGFTDTPGVSRKPKIVIIGDSYNWVLIDTRLPSRMFAADSRFWFYKKQLYDLDGKWISDNPSAEEIYQALQGADMVIFLSTEVLNHRIDFGFANWLKANGGGRYVKGNKI